MHAVWIVAAAIGVVAVLALVVIYRRAAARHSIEEAERAIAEDERERAS
jgi:hypothetical protein